MLFEMERGRPIYYTEGGPDHGKFLVAVVSRHEFSFAILLILLVSLCYGYVVDEAGINLCGVVELEPNLARFIELDILGDKGLREAVLVIENRAIPYVLLRL